MKFDKGDILKINGNEFQILENWDKGFDKAESGEENWFDWIGLLELSKSKMMITHWLKIFEDSNEIFLVKEGQKEEIKIDFDSIKIIKKNEE